MICFCTKVNEINWNKIFLENRFYYYFFVGCKGIRFLLNFRGNKESSTCNKWLLYKIYCEGLQP